MNVISKRGLRQQIEKHEDCRRAAMAWFRVARKSNWRSLSDVREQFLSADQVGPLLIFNLRGNAYRLIVRAGWPVTRPFVKALLTHAEYDRKEWMKWID